jgi:hypothetical protein
MESISKNDLKEMAATEATNFTATTEHLGATALLLSDIEGLYEALTPLLKSPEGSTDTSDQVFTINAIFIELMMCRMLLTKAALASLRMYHAEALTHLRRAIEGCAFAVRMSKHPELSRIWAEGGQDKKGEDTRYQRYRKAFKPQDVFPKQGHADHDPLLSQLWGRFDLCSKVIHGSILGVANPVGLVPKNSSTPHIRRINFFDMRPDSFVPTFFYLLRTHIILLSLFGRILKDYAGNLESWWNEYSYVSKKLDRHREQWKPNITSLIRQRNEKLKPHEPEG